MYPFQVDAAIYKWPAPGSEDTELGVLMEPQTRRTVRHKYIRLAGVSFSVGPAVGVYSPPIAVGAVAS
jgi:hypothetical protein